MNEKQKEFYLDPEIVFINHGSFGATPRSVLKAQQKWQKIMEQEPVHFMLRILPEALEAARETAAKFVNCPPKDLSFVKNATTGVNAVLQNLKLNPGDEVLTTTHRYDAVGNTLKHFVKKNNATLIEAELPFPVNSKEQILNRLLEKLSEKTKLVLIDQITSATATLFPTEEIIKALADHPTKILIDGAHAPGQINVDLEKLQVDYWTGNLHKWCCAPKGSALLYVHPRNQKNFHAPIISHGYEAGMQEEFNWMGTADYSAFLASKDAIELHEEWGGKYLRLRNHALMKDASELFERAFPENQQSMGQPTMAMRAFLFPCSEPRALYNRLWERHKIETVVHEWGNQSIVRISCFSKYNKIEDYEKLIMALKLEL